MVQGLIQKLIGYTQEMFDKLYDFIEKEKRYPANVAFTIFEILQTYKNRIEPLDDIYLRKRFIDIYEKLIETTYSHFFRNLYQSLLSYQYGNYLKLEQQINWAIYDMEIMHVNILSSILNNSYEKLEDSLINSFFERIKDMVECDRLVIENRDLCRLWIVTLYNLCTANKVLNLYLRTNRETYKKDSIVLCKKISHLLSEFVNQCNIEEIYKHPSLSTYILLNLERNEQFVPSDNSNQSAMIKIKKALLNIYSKASLKDLCWMYINLYHIGKEIPNSVSELILEKLSKTEYVDRQLLPQVVLSLAYYFSDKYDEKLHFNFPVEFERVNFENIFRIIFPKYLEVQEVNISSSGMSKLYNMSDTEIREALVKIIKTNSKIPNYVRQKLEIESQKPHTGTEISDFEFPIQIGGQTLYVCFPIKSGREISSTVPEKFIYQILRPFVHYKYCAVIFLTAKKCSLNLKNMIEKYKNRFSIPIEVLEYSNLGRLFKIYGVI